MRTNEQGQKAKLCAAHAQTKGLSTIAQPCEDCAAVVFWFTDAGSRRSVALLGEEPSAAVGTEKFGHFANRQGQTNKLCAEHAQAQGL